MPLLNDSLVASLPKAELHLHLEGSIQPVTAVKLASRQGLKLAEAEVAARYAPGDFGQFLDTFKWVASFLRTPEDYALIAEELAQELIAQNVVYAEVTLSVGVMLLRNQDPLANFEAIRRATSRFERVTPGLGGLKINWISMRCDNSARRRRWRWCGLLAKLERTEWSRLGLAGTNWDCLHAN